MSQLGRAILMAMVQRAVAVNELTGYSGEEEHCFWSSYSADMARIGLRAPGLSARVEGSDFAAAEARISNLPAMSEDETMALLGRFLADLPGSLLPNTRGDFHLGGPPGRRPLPGLTEVMEACVASALAVQTISGGYRWTERAAPAMTAAGHWDADGASREDVSARHIAALKDTIANRATHAIETMPDTYRAELARLIDREGPIQVISKLGMFRNGTGWRDAPDRNAPPGFGALGLSVATEIIKSVKPRAGGR